MRERGTNPFNRTVIHGINAERLGVSPHQPHLTNLRRNRIMAESHDIEEWRPVEGWPYEVSSMGAVRRALKGQTTSKIGIVKQSRSSTGYLTVALSDFRKRKTYAVHRLVAETFIGPKPSGKTEVAHGDGCKTNNALSNLRWATSSENQNDKNLHGKMPRAEGHYLATLTWDDVNDIRFLYCACQNGSGIIKNPCAYLSKNYNVNRTSIWRIVTFRHWKGSLLTTVFEGPLLAYSHH